MSVENESLDVLIITEDTNLFNQITNKAKGHNFTQHKALEAALSDILLINSTSLVIYDIEVVNNNVDRTIEEILKIKRDDPTQVLILVGDAEPLGEILKTRVQPLIFRAFNKPVNPNQIALAFKSANAMHEKLKIKQEAGEDISIIGAAENRTNIDSLSNQRNNNTAIIAASVFAVVAIAAWMFLRGDGNEQLSQNEINTTENTVSEENYLVDEVVSVNKTNELNQLAETAILEGRLTTPKGNNALELYNKVLAIDPYDSIAYSGKKSLANMLRESFPTLLNEGDFTRALAMLTTLQNMEPLNLSNDALKDDLQNAISKDVKNAKKIGGNDNLAKSSQILEQLDSKNSSSDTSSALKREQELLTQIDKSLNSNNLVPPNKDNAYTLVSSALKNNTISKSNLQSRVKVLSDKLLGSATELVTSKSFDKAKSFASLIQRLNVDRDGLAKLNKSIDSNYSQRKSSENVAKIVPAKLIKRSTPKYPDRALQREIEGWVDLRFSINAKGETFDIQINDSKPPKTFDVSAIRSVKRWRFTPAQNLNTGMPVASSVDSVKLNFQLAD